MRRLQKLFSPRKQSLRPSTQSSIEPYQYQSLSGPRSFRVLHLFRAEGENGAYDSLTLYGGLKEASIDDAPEYEALSYTWGEPTFPERIIIDGHFLSITANCASALRRLLRGKFERTVWVDSICINQSLLPDALQERSQQVRMMDEIYQRASRVVARLGDGDEASDVAIVALKALAQAYLDAKLPGSNQDSRRREYEKLTVDALTVSKQYPYGKLHGVFKRPRFQRVWVIQEIAMAKVVVFYCGNHSIRLEMLAASADFTRLPSPQTMPSHAHWHMYLELHQAIQEFIRRKPEGENLPFLRLSSILFAASFKKATKPEDKVYAFYGICNRLGFKLPEPDYQKPVNVVYTEAARCVLECDKFLEFLTSIEGTGFSKRLPSWVSDLTDRFEPEGPKTTSILWESFRAAGSSECCFNLLPDGQRLKVLGRTFDKLSSRGTTFAVDHSTTLLGGAPRNTGEIWENLIDALQNWTQIA